MVRTLQARAGALLVAAALVLAACSDPHDGRPQEGEADAGMAAATALAEAMSSGDYSGAPLAAEDRKRAQEQDDAVLQQLREVLTPAVEVSWTSTSYAEDGGSAVDAALSWTWDLPGTDEDWTYPAAVHLTANEDGEDYLADWSADLLAPDLTEGQVLSVDRTAPGRGDILGQDDEVLITARKVYRIGIDKTYIDSGKWQDQAIALAKALDLEDPEAYADRVLAAGERGFVVAQVVPQDKPGIDLDKVRDIQGVHLVDDERQGGPTTDFAQEILGSVGPATAEMIDESDGEIQQGDRVGLFGLQQAYQEQLHGFPGLTISAVDPDGEDEPAQLFHSDPQPGTPLRTTLAKDLQIQAEKILADQKDPSALVAIRPSTGEVLAAASGPASQGWSTATLAQYPPGSTFKMVTLLALLRSGADLSEDVSCPKTIEIEGREFQNYPGYPSSANGDITLKQAIARSCNTALMGQRDRIGAEDLASAAGALGLGGADSQDLGYPAWLGSVPQQAQGTDLAAAMIGQGDVLASPLSMATVAASIAAGKRVRPVLLPDYELPEQQEEPAALSETEATKLRQAMRAVVTEGTAHDLADIPGEEVFAKTGTAEGPEDETYGWLIAIQGDLAVAAFTADGAAGGAASAGPLAEKLLRSR
ncbi:MAG TPA: penicillin-binding transpeptidase domain-containing protein [Ruania sp.]|nr:penicillin-binding transpeptidase domain-containing protein [Ruania sp.]